MARPGAAWGAVGSMALCVAVLIASEFMPVSLLTPIATDLGVTEGQAGQAISISGLFAVVTSLFIAGLTRSIDRKVVLASFSVLLVLSGAMVTLAPDFRVLMIGRALLGRRDRRLLVDVDRDRHAPAAAGRRAAGARDAERGQRHRRDDLGAARQLSRRHHRLARRLLLRRAARAARARLAVDRHAVAAAARAPRPRQRLPAARGGRRSPSAWPRSCCSSWASSRSSPTSGPSSKPSPGFSVPAALAGVPGDRPRRRRGNLVHQPAAGHAPLCAPDRHSRGDGRNCASC